MSNIPNTMKRRVLLLQKLLYETTDEQHPLTTFEILDYLEQQNIVTNRKTIKGDIDLMVECGMDIVTVQSKPNKYFWASRSFEHAELKMLIDAVCSSRFITYKKSQVLSKNLLLFQMSMVNIPVRYRHLRDAGYRRSRDGGTANSIDVIRYRSA